MGGINVSTTPNAAGVCEKVMSVYVIDDAFQGLHIGPMNPPALCASKDEVNKICAYENLKVRW